MTHERSEPMPMKGGTTYTFVDTDVVDALEQTKGAAAGKNVAVFGGAPIFQECLKAERVISAVQRPALSRERYMAEARPEAPRSIASPSDVRE